MQVKRVSSAIPGNTSARGGEPVAGVSSDSVSLERVF
jgi:hypothetical protein